MANTAIVVDIETLGLKERAVVLSLGAAAFSFDKKQTYDEIALEGFYAKLNVDQQVKTFGRTMTKSTVQWWREQSAEARKVLEPTPFDHTVEQAIEEFTNWLAKVGFDSRKSYIFSRGNHFDMPKIESLFEDAGIDLAYNNWKVRDVRTAIDILHGTNDGYYTLQEGVPANFVAHHAMHDAAHDAAKLNELITA